MAEHQQGFCVASALLTNTVPQVPSQREYASSFSGDPEFEILLACCARQQKTEQVRRALQRKLDWGRLARLAEHHGVIPQVYTALAQADSFLLGEMSVLRQKYDRSVHQALWLTRELLRILEDFENGGIKAVPYKGPVLAQILHGTVTSRQFADLDILVQPNDLTKIRVALAELGYETSLRLSLPEQRASIAGGYEWAFHLGEHKNLLEIQWRILPRFYGIDFDLESLFERAVAIEFCGSAVRTLCPEDLMLVLCAHAAKHAWMQLSWIREMGELSNSRALNWGGIWREAETLGICRIVGVGCLLANNLLGVEMPDVVQGYVQRDGKARLIAGRVLAELQQEKQFDTESLAYFRMIMDSRERWLDRMRLLWRLALTPSVGEWSAIRLPEWLFPLYRVVRFARLFQRWLHGSRVSD
jgi:putative nucleotidyltransferase-like protein